METISRFRRGEVINGGRGALSDLYHKLCYSCVKIDRDDVAADRPSFNARDPNSVHPLLTHGPETDPSRRKAHS